MQKAGRENYWSPYIAGACAGLVLVLSVWFTGKYFGASTSFVRSAGLIEKIFSAERVERMNYFVKTAPKIEWLRNEAERRGLDLEIEVDGGVNPETAPIVAKAGAHQVVAGSAVYGKPDRAAAIEAIRKAAG